MHHGDALCIYILTSGSRISLREVDVLIEEIAFTSSLWVKDEHLRANVRTIKETLNISAEKVRRREGGFISQSFYNQVPQSEQLKATAIY